MLDEILTELKESFDGTVKGLQRELAKIRAGRANIAMLDGVRVEYYGSMTPISQVATLKVADPRMITIQPWEKSLIADVEKAISAAGLGLNPSNDGINIRVPIPPLSEDRRRDLARVAKRAGEDHKIALRNHRRDCNETLKELEKESEITEDDMHRGYDQVNQLTETFNKKIDELLSAKESEIMAV
jgi:ribosome recycling factor